MKTMNLNNITLLTNIMMAGYNWSMYHIFLDRTLFLIVQWVINSFIKMIVFDWYVIHCTWGRKSNYVNHPLLHWCTKRPNRYNWISSKTLCNSFLGYYDMKDRNIIELRKIAFRFNQLRTWKLLLFARNRYFVVGI